MGQKIGATVLNWNGERFIYAHLKMLTQGGVDKIVVIQGRKPWDDYAKEYGLSSEPDKSEEIIRKYFPQVEIIYANKDIFGSHLYNQGLEALSDCDIVLRLDYDMFLTKKDWKRLMSTLKNMPFPCYRLDFSNNTINYYYDYKHGVKNAKEWDIIAASPKNFYFNILEYPEKGCEILSSLLGCDIVIHHFRGWKGFGMEKDWIEDKKPNFNGVFASDLLLEDKKGKWRKCPKEIIDMLEEKYG